MSLPTRFRDHWTVGADALLSLEGDGGRLHVPMGQLHAVNDDGLIDGRSICQAPVILLDPAAWSWPDYADDNSATSQLCWDCLALTA
jgi:hypothetical protein